ncbi:MULTISPECIES: methyltransferase domain-containing protein [unclassified Prochlorococcus]|uniref:methyltransferase domain-containing protein n=1 Tax=unclassified Prochlorococcus TaxID=2627481 RepID=UPI000533AAD5|nr:MULTISPECIES: methyltransferase domain-containing protein [unclassified Prochlorococcus]KGG14731.1 2-methyl-6-phytyl-1,4-benzoquinone methyltransferase [Prochlorococcus sp. MIT 0602]KGG15840.1 2-methyl-6-phytyl-1,4-benzoquinone methyltransferase [Prochlorococcus sp. MIT 0603]
MLPFLIFLGVVLIGLALFIWILNDRKYKSSKTVSSSYDAWTNDRLLEKLWGEHIHLGYYPQSSNKTDFKQAKIDFVHKLVQWSGLDKLPKGSRILDIGCGIGGSARILAKDYGFEVVAITVSLEQVKRANELTPDNLLCDFQLMDALDLDFEDGTFDGIWSVEAGAHIADKQLYADEMLRVLRPGGVLAVADWNRRDFKKGGLNLIEGFIMKQLLNQWSHPEFSSIRSFQQNLRESKYSAGIVEINDWTEYTYPSWEDSIIEGIRRFDVLIELGPKSFIQALREVPTILVMKWAFANGLMQFGIFRSRG